MTQAPLFPTIAIIGMGHIGSSLARAIGRDPALVGTLIAADRDPEVIAAVGELGLADEATTDIAAAVALADLVVLAVPISACVALAPLVAGAIRPGAVVSDVSSVKQAIVEAYAPVLPPGVHFVPGHPIAGTENSGPRSGLAELFQGRWTILTPPPGTDRAAIDKVAALWRAAGAEIVEMEAAHHDKVLAITSHLPHLIAYTIVGTAVDLEASLQAEVIKFSASGFRDFTRIAASDPTMWRDIFLNNREAVLEMLQRLTEDLSALQRAIRWGEGDVLFDHFTRARRIRREVIAAKQA
jgi:cyclohexadieny/prephenate dehydrogenase